MKTKLIIPTIGTLALLVLVGQGCPGQEAEVDTDTQMDADMQMEDDMHMEDESMQEGQDDTAMEEEGPEVMAEAGTETAFGLTLPAGSVDVSESQRDENTTVVSFSVSEGSVEEVHNYLAKEAMDKGWEVTTETYVGFRDTGVIVGSKDGEEINIDTSTNPRTGGVVVDMSNIKS